MEEMQRQGRASLSPYLYVFTNPKARQTLFLGDFIEVSSHEPS